jgi:hypothetical protein
MALKENLRDNNWFKVPLKPGILAYNTLESWERFHQNN